MIKKLFNKTITVFLTFIFITGLFPPVLFSQPVPPSFGDLKGFNKSIFDNHFSKADREINPERWLAEAKLGVTQAISAWELIAGSLYENPLLIKEAKNQIENWSNEELEKRFSQWLIGRFYGAAAEASLMSLSQVLSETQLTFSDNLVLSHDLTQWRNEADLELNNTRLYLENTISRMYPELLAYIPNELRETYNMIINETASSINTSIKDEFENIASREERKFISRRTRDINNIQSRQIDNKDSANKFTEKLIADAEEICRIGINELNARIEQAEAGTGDLALLGDEWLKLYKEQFDKGLRAWEEAEERFFIRRIEWEHDSNNLFNQGLETWNSAFDNFENQRKTWELNVKRLFDEGVALFKNISDNFENSVKEARAEFELNMAMRIGEGTERVKALIDIYLTASSTSISAMENVRFWHNDYNAANKIDPDDPAFSEWLKKQNNTNDDTFNNFALTEMKNAYDTYISYYNTAVETRDMIFTNYAGLFGTGALKDILSPNASSEDFYLNEYQIALIRAEALVLYWEKKTNIAAAVALFADEFNTGKKTAADSFKAWESAKTAYNQSLSDYKRELDNLTTIGNNIESQKNALSAIVQNLQIEEDKLNQLQSDYNVLVSISGNNLERFYYTSLNDKYIAIAEQYELLRKSGSTSVYKTMLDYGLAWGLTEQRETAQAILNLLIYGDNSGTFSLSALENMKMETEVRIRLALIDLFSDSTNGELRSMDSAYSGADWYSKLTGISFSEKDKANITGEKISELLIEYYNIGYAALLKKHFEFELNSLRGFINNDPNVKLNEHALLNTYLSDKEDAAYIYHVLLNLQYRIENGLSPYAVGDFENAIINIFLSGTSFFSGSEIYLSDYINDLYFRQSITEFFNEYAAYNSFTQRELWQKSCLSLSNLFRKYNIEPANGVFPDIIKLGNAIKNKQGDIFKNTSLFLSDFDNCFSLIPEWLENEIILWKHSLIDYIAVLTVQLNINPVKDSDTLNNEYIQLTNNLNELFKTYELSLLTDSSEAADLNDMVIDIYNTLALLEYQILITNAQVNYNYLASLEDETHWRQYLTVDYIENPDPAVKYAETLLEGIYEDVLFRAVYYTNRINDSFQLFTQTDIPSLNRNADYYKHQYFNAIANISKDFNSLENKYNEIGNSARAYNFAKMSPDNILKELLAYDELIKNQTTKYNAEKEIYFDKSEAFISTGSLYDSQYKRVKKAYENTENTRFEYEKQDAIKRWASTSYLNIDFYDLENSTAKLSKARTVLNVLSDLYSEKEIYSYNNPEYNELYSAYEQSFQKKIILHEALELVTAEAAQEYKNNSVFYSNYRNSLNQLGHVNQNYSGYTSSIKRSEWTIKDLITIVNGQLVFSRDGSMRLSGIDSSKADELNNYFISNLNIDNERFKISAYEDALRGLSERMSVYFSDSDKFNQWSYARDYLLLSLISANKDIDCLDAFYKGFDKMGTGKALGKLNVMCSITSRAVNLSGFFNASYHPDYIGSFASSDIDMTEYNLTIYKEYWDKLTKEEKADLEFYIILTLNNSDYSKGFFLSHTLDVYKKAQSMVRGYINKAEKGLNNILLFGLHWRYRQMRDINKLAITPLNTHVSLVDEQIRDWKSGLTNYLSAIQTNAVVYRNSCEILNAIEGKGGNGGNINWADIETALTNNKMKQEKIDKLKTYWKIIHRGYDINYKSVSEALSSMHIWAVDSELSVKEQLNIFWENEFQNQVYKESLFLTAANAYITGTVNIEILKKAAANAYGNTAASWKNHLYDQQTVLLNDLSLYLESNNYLYPFFSGIKDEITLLTRKTLEDRYKAELNIREMEWSYIRNDIAEKNIEWQAAAIMIIENGRADWISSRQKMDDALKQWTENFKNEFNRVNNEWNEAYLAGLEDKESWLQMAADAANRASTESLLLLLGTEGERLARFADTREPFGIRNAVPNAQALMDNLLQSSGIINMTNAFASLNGISGTTTTAVLRGIGGISTWDTAIVKKTASDMARKAGAEIANSETKKLAYNTRQQAESAIKSLTATVDSANNSFRAGMDEHFISTGLWKKSGNNYVKDVLKGATLFSSIITEKAAVEGYANYIMEPIVLQTNLDENFLSLLETIAIRELLDNAYLEIKKIADDIFGTNEEPKEITEHSGKTKREQAPGKFGAHIGYTPAPKDSGNIGKKKESMFYDQGAGELGRLLTEYTYWAIIETMGQAELKLAPWEKRMWNDDDIWLKAPSFKLVNNIVASIIVGCFTYGAGWVAIPISIGAAVANEIAFGSLDLAFEYKELDEVAFNVGKTFVISSITSAAGALFNGVATVGGTVIFDGLTNVAVETSTNVLNKIAARTIMTGLEKVTTNIATNAINGITYSTGGNWGYNKEVLGRDYVKNMMTNTLSSMTNAFTTTGFTAINSGLDLSKLKGFNNYENKINVKKFNNLLGSLAGQAVNYAMGGDFTLNLLNLSMFSDGKLNSGLLELNLGRNGATMNIGTGGANVSIDNLIDSYKGALIWDKNIQIGRYIKEQGNVIGNDSNTAIAFRVQYGYGDAEAKKQLNDIFKGKTIIKTDAEGDYIAKTTLQDGKRIISITNFKQDKSDAEQFLFAIILGHEAHRDGLVTDKNSLETIAATMAHTKMALNILFDGEKIAYNENLNNDIHNYISALASNNMSSFEAYVNSNYDSSADYWKLIIQDGVAGFMWDNQYTFDLSAIGIEERAETLDGNTLEKIRRLGHSDLNSNDFNNYVETFYYLNAAAQTLETALKISAADTPRINQTGTTTNTNVVRSQIETFFDALRGVQSSGLYIKTDPLLDQSGNGPNIFTSGGGTITNHSGMRAMNFNGNFYFESHIAWDLWNENTKLAAPINGNLNLDFTSGGGFNITTSDGNKSFSYGHSGAESIKDLISVFSYNGVSVDGSANYLSGITQNMTIGTMGNTGTYTTGAHVHLVYAVNGQAQHPGTFFDQSIYKTTAWADTMSGFPGTRNNLQLNYEQVQRMYQYLSADRFNAFASASSNNQKYLFNYVYNHNKFVSDYQNFITQYVPIR